jgi:diguanylate cyclase (GGDEF)-like protein/PAS domain S-box-containing protein
MFGSKTPTKSGSVKKGSSHILATWGIVGLLAAALTVMIGLETSRIISQRSGVLDDSRKDTANLASSLIQHAELTFRTADALLIGVVERLEHESLGPETRRRLKAWFVQEISHSSQFVNFSVVDSDGAMVVNSTSENEQGDFSDRDYFSYHRTHDDNDLHIGAPIRGRTVDGWLIPATRRFNRADGSFGGVAVAAINPKYFQNIYDRLELGHNGAVYLVSLDGRVLVRRPFVEENVGRDMAHGHIFTQLKQAPAGSFEAASSADGVRRLTSYEKGHTYPLVVSVAQGVTELLAPWQQRALRRLVETFTITALIILMGAFVWRATKTLATNSITLRETNDHFDAALANMSNGVSMFDADGRLMVWNESYVELYGMSPEVIRRGASIRSIVEHRKQAGNLDLDVDGYIGEFRQKLADSGRSTSTSRLTDGRTVSVVNTAIAGGGWVGMHEDITERIRGEESMFQQATELARINMRFDAALSNMSHGISMFDQDRRLMVWNQRYAEIYRLPQDLLAARPHVNGVMTELVARGILKGDTDRRAIDQKIAAMDQYSIDSQRVEEFSDGRLILVSRQPMAGGGWVSTHEDITERVRREEELRKQAAELTRINMQFDAALSTMTQGLSMFDDQKRLIVWNDRYAELYQVPSDLLKVGTPFEAIVTDRLARGVVKGDTSALAVKTRVAELAGLPPNSSRIDELADGRFVLLARQPMEGGGWLTIIEDITERRRAEAEIVHLARHDVLTGLANRAEFNAKLDEASKRLKRGGGAVTVMMLDLDKFKAVNDTLGHPSGDQLLVEVARRLQSTIRETDVLARLGGDEFAILQEGGASQHEGAIALALRIINAISQPFDLHGQAAGVGTSIGIAMAPENGVEPEELLKSADLALYDAKANGRNDFRIYQAAMREVAHSQQSAESELRDAIARDEFELHYQPVVDVRTRRLCGAEALIRWRHPAKGLIAPDKFIPLAESTGLIVPLGEWILQRACADAALWPAHLKIAVNISAVQFKRGNLFDVILCTLVETGLAPERLELEITETSLLENQDAHLTTIRQLKNLGISMALDDFGTGYASVTYLTSFPFDNIKIDRTFTHGVLTRRDCAAVVSSVLALAQGLGTVTTVEGIDTEEQLEYMRNAGAEFAQGYLFGRPVPLAQLDLSDAALPREMVA